VAVVSPCRVGIEIVVVRPVISGKRTPGFGRGSVIAANRRAIESATNGGGSIDTDLLLLGNELGDVNARRPESIRQAASIYLIDDAHLRRSLDTITLRWCDGQVKPDRAKKPR
jgi:hypothetical protein